MLELEGVAAIRVTSRRRGIVVQAVDGGVGKLVGDDLDAIQVVRVGDCLEITEQRWEDGDGGEESGLLELWLPAASSWKLAADTANGSVLVAGITGSVSVRTTNGAVTLQDLTGTIDVRCANGSITAERIVGQFNVSSANGKVTVREAELTGGKFHNASGRMVLQFRPAGRGKVSIMSGSSRVLLAVPEDADVMLTVKSRGRMVNRLGSSVVESGPGFGRVTLGSGAFSIFVRTLGSFELVGFDEFESKERREGERFSDDEDDHASEDPEFSFEIPEEIWEFLKEMRGYGLKFGKRGEEIARQVYEAFGPGRHDSGYQRGPGGPQWRGRGHSRRSHDHRGRGWNGSPGPAHAEDTGPAETSTEEEVKLTLEMLKDGKISAEEAARLISALRR